ncbi:protein rolling stone-like [Clavelina lepadiformis]|uniref:protein rolling stone-like n=1 Tax=Clavelina lepadiformis TaxID=159417 RepID=UPI0040414507
MTSNLVSFRDEFRLKHFKFSSCSSNRFIRLQWSSNRRIHLSFRVFLLLYCLGWLIADLVTNIDPYYYAYLTHWAEANMCLYLVAALLTSIFTKPSRVKQISAQIATSSANEPEEEDTLRWYHVITWVLLNIFITSEMIVCILYWVGRGQDLIEPSKSLLSVNIHVHVIAAFLALIELFANDIPIRILHFYWAMSFGLVYMFFTLILHWSGTISNVYGVLNWQDNPSIAIAMSLGMILVGVPLVHFIVGFGFYRLRTCIWKMFGQEQITEQNCQSVAENDSSHVQFLSMKAL